MPVARQLRAGSRAHRDSTGSLQPQCVTLGASQWPGERSCFPLPYGVRMPEVISPGKLAATLVEHWSPRVVAELDDSYVKVARVLGTLAWHSHENEDELFYVLAGTLTIEMEDRSVVLHEGDAFVVPKGVRHNPVAERECHIMLIERKTTLHTGTEVTEKTRSVAEQLRSE